MAGEDFNVSVKLAASTSGEQQVKNFGETLKKAFVEGMIAHDEYRASIKKGEKDTTNYAAKVREALSGMGNVKIDVAANLKIGLQQAQAKVLAVQSDLRKLYALKVSTKPTDDLLKGIDQVENELKKAQGELSKFKSLDVGGGGSSDGVAGGKGVSGLLGTLVKSHFIIMAMQAALRAVKDIFSSVVSEGLKMNEYLETTTAGIATNITAQYNLVNAGGKKIEGEEAYAAALQMSKEQMLEIRKAGLETAATTQQLGQTFQAAMAFGAGAGIKDLTILRKLTIDITNAATALGISQEEAVTAMRAVLSGREVEENKLARILVGTGEQVRQWKEQGILVDTLNERLTVFSEGVKKAAGSWAVVKSNMEETFQVFAGDVTSGLFDQLKGVGTEIQGLLDPKTLGVTDKFGEISSLLKDVFTGIGVVLKDIIDGVLVVAEYVNNFLSDNKVYVEEWKNGLKEIWVAVKGVFKTLFDVAKSLTGVRGDTGELQIMFTAINLTLKAVALTVAGIADGFRVVTAAVLYLGGMIIDVMVYPIRDFLSNLGSAAGLVNKSWETSLKGASDALGRLGAKVRARGKDLFDPFLKGESAVQNLMKSFSAVGPAADKAANAAKRAGDKIESQRFPNKNTKSERDAINQAVAVAKATAEVAMAAEKDRLARETQDLEYRLSHQQISIQDYYDRIAAIQRTAVENEIAAKKKQLADLPDDAKRVDDRIKIQGEINLLLAKQGDIEVENNRKKKDAIDTLNRSYTDLRQQLSDLVGVTTVDQVTAAAAEKFRVMKEKLVAEFGAGSEQAKLIDQLIDVNAAKASFDLIKKQYDLTLSEMQMKEDAIREKQTSGVLGPIEAQRQLDAVQKEYTATLTALLPKLDQYAAAVGSAELSQNLQKTKTELSNLKTAQNEFGKSMEQSVTSGWVTMFQSIADGTKSAGDAVKDFARSVLQTFTQLISEILAKAALSKLLSSFGGTAGASGGGWGVIFSSAFSAMAKADGGYISGPGTGTSDSIPAYLSNGEYVLQSAAVRKVGVPYLNWLNGGQPVRGGRFFAEGGLAVSPSSGDNNSRITVGLEDGLVLRKLDTPAGNKAILKVIENNPQFIRSLLS